MAQGRAEKLVKHAQRITLLSARFLEGCRQDLSFRDQAVAGSLFSCSHPIASGLRIAWIRVLLSAIAATCLAESIVTSVSALHAGKLPAYRHYRFTNLQHRSQHGDPVSAGIESFGMLRLGEPGATGQGDQGLCLPAGDMGFPGVLREEGATVVLSLDGDGQEGMYEAFWIKTLSTQGTQGQDAVRFVLEADDDESFPSPTVVGASTHVNYFNRIVWTEGEAEVPEGRGSFMVVDARPGVRHLVAFGVGRIVLYSMAVWTVGLAWVGRVRQCKAAVQNALGVQVCLCFIGAMLFILREDRTRADVAYCLYAMGILLSFGVSLAIVKWVECASDLAFLCLAIFQFTLRSLVHGYLFGSSSSSTTDGSDFLTFYEASWAVYPLGALMVRVHMMRQAVKRIEPGRKRYKQVWQRIVQEQKDGIVSLNLSVGTLRKATSDKVARQMNRPKPNSLIRHGGGFFGSFKQNGLSSRGSLKSDSETSASIIDLLSDIRLSPNSQVEPLPQESELQVSTSAPLQPSANWDIVSYLSSSVLQSQHLHAIFTSEASNASGDPIQSLDHLYSQAFLVQDHFLEVVVKVASLHHGQFLVKSVNGEDPAFAPWDGSDCTKDQFEFGGLKSVASCINKLDSALSDDVSLLLDMCRETLYFDSVGDIESVLSDLWTDETINIVMIKSTMDPAFDPDQPAGFRAAGMPFVSVYFSLAGKQTAMDLGVEKHVCELLLVLTDVKRVQTAEMREAYQFWRRWKRVLKNFNRVKVWIQHLFGSGRSNATVPDAQTTRERLESPVHGSKASTSSFNSRNQVTHSFSFTRSLTWGSLKKKAIVAEEIGESKTYLEQFMPPNLTYLGSLDAERKTSIRSPKLSTRTSITTTTTQVGLGISASTATAEAGGEIRRTFSSKAMTGAGFEITRTECTAVKEAGWEISEAGGEITVPAVPVETDETLLEHVAGTDVFLSKEMVDLLQGLARATGLGIQETVDQNWNSLPHLMDISSSASSAFYSNFPYTVAVGRKPLRIVLTLGGLFWGLIAFRGFQASGLMGRPYSFGPYKHYRFEALLTRNGTKGRDVVGPGVSEFGILGISRCSPSKSLLPSTPESGLVEESPSFSAPVGSSFLVSYPTGASMTGWYATSPVADGSEGYDPSFFNVWASNDDLEVGDGSCTLGRTEGNWWGGGHESEWCGAAWTRVGAPKWRFFQGVGFPLLPWDFLDIAIDPPKQRGYRSTWVLVLDWKEYFFGFAIAQVLVCLSCVAIIVSSSTRLRSRWQWFLSPEASASAFLFATVASYFTSAALNIGHDGRLHHGLESLAKMVPFVVLWAIVVWQSPRTFVPGLILSGISNLVLWSIICTWFWHRPFYAIQPNGILMMTLGLMIRLNRAVTMRRCARLVKNDQKRYDKVWDSLMQDEDAIMGVTHLQKVVRMIGLDDTNYCRQHNRLRADSLAPSICEKVKSEVNTGTTPLHPLFQDLGIHFLPLRPDFYSKVNSFNQLYTASVIANLLLLERVKVWAHQSDGMFKLFAEDSQQSRFVKWRDAKKDEALLRKLAFPSMKRHSRALEKLLRSYQLDISRLLDISRSSIVFDTMEQLTAALGIIATDDNVRVERIKNRMCPEYSSDESAGYRDVCINLRPVNKEAVLLGAEMHMCEVQLILRQFAEIKTEGELLGCTPFLHYSKPSESWDLLPSPNTTHNKGNLLQ